MLKNVVEGLELLTANSKDWRFLLNQLLPKVWAFTPRRAWTLQPGIQDRVDEWSASRHEKVAQFIGPRNASILWLWHQLLHLTWLNTALRMLWHRKALNFCPLALAFQESSIPTGRGWSWWLWQRRVFVGTREAVAWQQFWYFSAGGERWSVRHVENQGMPATAKAKNWIYESIWAFLGDEL